MGRQYNKPPLIEAVCEFRFEPGEPWDLAIPGLLYERLRETFPKRRQARALETTMLAGPDAIQQQMTQVDRLQMLREDETALVQVSPHLLSVNHLKPYPSWAGFISLIREALEVYRTTAKPKGLQRIGLRYINRIEMPGKRLDLEYYFDFYPFVGTRLPEDFGNFLVAIHLLFQERRDILRLQLSDTPADQPDVSAFTLDLDYFLAQTDKVNFESVLGWLEEAHDTVEETFEGCIKDTLRERFEEVNVS
ncbi:MAG: TIGR04255 family protein [Candidatus Entotheonellia bacterium]